MRLAVPGATRPGGWNIHRAATFLLGVYLLGTAALHATRGEWLYTDFLRLQVPVPVAALLGALLLSFGLLGKRW